MDKHLTKPAAALARRAPEEWAAFLSAFEQYSAERIENLLQSPTGDTLHVAQGHAHGVRRLLSYLQTCVQDSDKMEKTNGRRS